MPETGAKKSFYIIDGHAQIFRAYHAIRSLNSPVTGEPTNATFGFVGMLLKLLRENKPDYLVVTIDVSGDKETFRSELYPDYKAHRPPPPEDLHPQTLRIVELCRVWGIPVIGVEGVEADDVIATLCARHAGDGGLDIRIVSRDKDLQQLITERVSLFDVHTGESVDTAALAREKGIAPGQVADMLALMGDNVDNVPGVPGVGPKTAAKLISQYGTLDNLLAHTGELSGKLKENIEQSRGLLALSRKLVALRGDVPFEFSLKDAAVSPPPADALRPLFKQLGFNRHLIDLEKLAGVEPTADEPKPVTKTKPTAPDPGGSGLFAAIADNDHAATTRADYSHYRAITTKTGLSELVATLRAHVRAGKPISVDTETDQLDPMRANLCGVCLAWETGSGVYIPVRSPEANSHLDERAVMDALRPILEDPAVVKIGHNIKYDSLVLRRAGVTLAGLAETGFDTMVASHLIDAGRTSHKLDNLSLALLGYEMIPITDLIGRGAKQKSMVQIPIDRVTAYGAEDADIALRLYELFAPQLRVMKLEALFREMEMPLVEVLAELEYNGILIDPDELDRQRVGMDKRIDELRDEITRAAGEEFNPDSPKQLAEVMFKKLKATVVKRGKSGPSTDVEVLETIAADQEPPASLVASLILEHRQLAKLRGTYLAALKDAIHPVTKRIHTSFHQTGAATGRLASSDPNLQNIPIRTEIGRRVRKAFVAPSGCVLLGADYSQVELRLLAHFSRDENLTSAFENDLDIHSAVAAQVFGVELGAVTSEQRTVAKAINFGIVYGITPYGLARILPGSPGVEAARKIIDDYKQRYPKIDAFLQQCIESAKRLGYVETIHGRRRPVPQITSRDPNMASFGRRIAVNSVVQGSAADLIKIAMVRLHRRIRDEKLPMKMLLQIHDELVFEVPKEHVEAESAVVRHEMQTAMHLTVPLKVDINTGANWFECK